MSPFVRSMFFVCRLMRIRGAFRYFWPLATIAIPAEAGQDDLAATCELVTALRQSRDAHGCRASVIVTIEAEMALITDAYVHDLLDRGAFVVQPGLGTSGDHIHHFPLRAATLPRKGYRLICVDLADHLACWAAGSSAVLHVIPFDFEDAAGTLSRLSNPYASGICRATALNLHFHVDADDPGNQGHSVLITGFREQAAGRS